MRQCYRRFSNSNLFTIFGVFKRLGRVGGSDGVLKGGSERGWKRAPRGQSCMLSRSRYSGDGHAWNSMSDMQVGSLCVGGGFVFWKGGSQKGGFGRTRRTPPLVTGLHGSNITNVHENVRRLLIPAALVTRSHCP